MEIGLGLIVGAGIIVSTFVAMRTARFGMAVLAGPACLALAMLGADALARRWRGLTPWPSAPAWILSVICVLACTIVALRDPKLVASFVPIIGASSWVTLLFPDRAAARCESR
jgi:hypothetical protein